jgi:hypothetical protein
MGVIRKAERLSNGNFEIFFEIRDESNGFALALLMIVPAKYQRRSVVTSLTRADGTAG